MSAARFGLLLASGLAVSAPVFGGAFIFSNSTGLPIDLITHPKNYSTSGGTITNTVCLNTSVLPSGVSAATVEATLQKAIRTWNRQRQVTGNISFPGENNDIPGVFASEIDYESTLLHEMGHCIGLAHPNLATESGLLDPDRNSTQARTGADGVFDINDGADNILGSRDDLRDDDINRYWFRIGSNDPMDFPDTIDSTTFSVDLGDLPGGHNYAANGDRDVLDDLGYANTESVMQQGQFNDETQRRITPEDLATLRIGMAGIDEIQGNSNDYTLTLTYGGQVTSNTCDINVTFGASFAVCSTSGSVFVSPNNHAFITSAVIEMGQTTNWYFSQTENTSVSASSSPSSPSLGASATINVSVDRLSGDMTGTPSGSFEASVNDQTCTGTLSASDANTSTGSCSLAFNSSGAQTVSVLYLGDEGFDASETSFGVTVAAATPTVTINSDLPDPSTVGQSYSVVVSVSGSSGTPTGTVAVSEGSANCAITLSGGSGSCSLTSTTAGAKTITANYSGNGTYTTGSDTTSHTVNKATPTVAITSVTPEPSFVGQSYTVSFTVSGAGVTPTGTVQVDDGTVNCSTSLSGGSGSCMLTSTSAGTKTLTAAYAGDANYSSANDTDSHTVNRRTPTVSITSDDPDPSQLGNAFTVAVSVSGSGSTPTGSVTVDDGTVNCAITLSGGSGSCDLTPTSAGAKTLTASYGGDAEYDTGSDTESHTVDKATPAVTITSDNPEPSSVGQSYTVAVTVTGSAGTPTGSVTVDDGTVNCAITLSGGSGSCDLASTTAGVKTLTAGYGGDANYDTGSDTESHTVNQGTPTVSITNVVPEPSFVGQAYTVSFTVSGAGVTPTGTVQVDDGTVNCSTSLSSGSGSCMLTSTSAGTKTLTAAYAGDANYNSANDTDSHTVNRRTPTVTITSDEPEPSALGSPFTVEVSVTGSGSTPTGSVTVDDGTVNCAITLSGGSGSCDLTPTSVGAKTLTASYGGNAEYEIGSDTEPHTVTQAAATVTIASIVPSPSVVGQTYAVTVNVSGAGGTPTGTVSVGDGSTTCMITLSGGSGSCNLASNTAGTKTITADYSGDTNYAAGSDTESHTVNAGTPVVTITSVLPASPTVGDNVNVSVSVSGAGVPPTGPVTVSLTGEDCTINLSGGSGSCDVLATSAGSGLAVAANYSGDANYIAGSGGDTVDVAKAQSTIAIDAISPNPPLQGLPYSVQVTVTGPAVTPTGNVNVDDGESSCNITLSAGSGSCELTPSTLGTRTVTVTYPGDTNFLGDDTDIEVTVIPATAFIFADGFED